MERVLSPEERIRKAEDLYYRRKLKSMNKQTARVNVDNKTKNKTSKGFIKQIIICILIYLLWYGFQNSNYIFSENVIENVKEVLEYDISISSLVNKSEEQAQEIQEEATVETSTTAIQETLSVSEVNTKPEVVMPPEEASSIDQMKEDAEYIKSNYNIIKPLSGTITSRFGVRESENPNVAGYHTGLDIAVNEGTVFVSAMSGTVELVSSEGSLRQSF